MQFSFLNLIIYIHTGSFIFLALFLIMNHCFILAVKIIFAAVSLT